MKTDAEVLTGRQKAAKVLGEYGAIVVRMNWLLALAGRRVRPGVRDLLARVFARYSETLLTPFS